MSSVVLETESIYYPEILMSPVECENDLPGIKLCLVFLEEYSTHQVPITGTEIKYA